MGTAVNSAPPQAASRKRVREGEQLDDTELASWGYLLADALKGHVSQTVITGGIISAQSGRQTR